MSGSESEIESNEQGLKKDPIPEEKMEPIQVEKGNKAPFVAGIYSQHEFAYVIAVGVCLSFNAGYINGCCLSGFLTDTGRTASVAGYTGAYTTSALSLASMAFEDFAFKVGMILSFIGGSLFAGFLTPNPTALRLEPSYGPTFFMGGILMLIATVLSAQGDNFIFFFFVAAANGIQNGISSLYSSNLIRSTHLTGTSTDIGLFIGQLLRGNDKNFWKLIVLITLATTFWLGGLISYFAARHLTTDALIFSSCFYFAIGLTFIIFLKLKLQVTIGAAVFGTWSWRTVLDKLQSIDVDMNGLFDAIDEDGTGSIDRNELMQALKKVGISSNMTDILMKYADTDHDGTISRNEWQTVCQSVKA